MERTLLDIVNDLNSLNDDNLTDRVIRDDDVKWCLSELQDILEILGDITDSRLREMMKAEREGRCVVLPCKVGDAIYIPDKNNLKVLKKEVRQVSFNHHGKWIVFSGCMVVDVGEIGKDVFITREEAESSLKLKEREKKDSDVSEVMSGEWIEIPDGTAKICSYCNADWNVFDNETYRFIHCPNCGANMS